MVRIDVNIPRGSDADAVLRLGREVAISCPHTQLWQPISGDLEYSGVGHNFMNLRIEAYVYDHRYELPMQTDVLRRAHRELMAHGVLGPSNHHLKKGRM
jgi:hypothetical protein